MLDKSVCSYVIRNRPAALRERFDRLAEAISVSTITFGEFLDGAERSARQSPSLLAVKRF
jgi:tRNA(fMet)-specific endonuclease VapC